MRKNYWTITPSARPDIYETIPSSQSHMVTFITDIDSITFEVKLNYKYNFVILYGKDSAFTQIAGEVEYSPPKPFTTLQLKQIQDVAVSFRSIYAAKSGELADHKELEIFGNTIGNAQIIALGELTHGTSEFFSLKHSVLEYAVLNLRIFAIEVNQLAAEQRKNRRKKGKCSKP